MAKKTREHLLEALRSPEFGAKHTEGTVTTVELARLAECSYAKALKMVHTLVEEGKLEPAQVVRKNIQGKMQPVAGYRILE